MDMPRSCPNFNPQRQHGMSKWGWLFAAIVFVSAVTLTLRLGPHYLDFRIVTTILDRLPAESLHQKMTKEDIREVFTKQFRIESFRIPLKEVLTIDRNRDRTIIDVNYEVREHLAYNVDVVLVFSEQRTYE